MSALDGYRVRPPAMDDLAGVTAVLVADELDDAGRVTLGEDFVRARWNRTGFDLSTDAWVAVGGDDLIVGHALVLPAEDGIAYSLGIVHPSHRGRGIGSALLDRIDERSAQLPRSRLRHAVNAADGAAAGLLEARGFGLIRHYWHMERELNATVDPGPAPDGIEIASVRPPEDLRAVHAVLLEAFAHDPIDRISTFDQFVEDETGPDFDASLWLLARDGDEPLGTLTASVGEHRGWVDYLGVVPAGRGRGIGAALLRHSFASFADRGLERALVSVHAENPTGATALYERVGMRVVKRWDLWEREP
jgi:mycothiol synthase